MKIKYKRRVKRRIDGNRIGVDFEGQVTLVFNLVNTFLTKLIK